MNLVQTSILFRRGVNIFLGLMVLYIVVKLSTPLAKDFYNTINPPKDPPTLAYGLLDPLEFVEKETAGTVDEVVLNTSSGRLPVLPNKLPVYKYADIPVSFQAGRDAQEDARVLGFSDDEQITDLKGNQFGWKDKETGAILEIDINTRSLRLNSNLINFQTVFPTGKITSTEAELQARRILETIRRFDNPQYKRETGRVIFAKILNNEITTASTPFEAQLARVDFFRKVRDYKILGPDPQEGLVSILIKTDLSSGGPKVLNHPKIQYYDWELIEDDSGTYPLISVQEAWNAVAVEKKGVVVSVIPEGESVFSELENAPRVDTILINSIYLAYYDNTTQQDYMQPIYVFEGDYNIRGRPGGEITIYFPAVQGQYIKPIQPTTPTAPDTEGN